MCCAVCVHPAIAASVNTLCNTVRDTLCSAAHQGSDTPMQCQLFTPSSHIATAPANTAEVQLLTCCCLCSEASTRCSQLIQALGCHGGIQLQGRTTHKYREKAGHSVRVLVLARIGMTSILRMPSSLGKWTYRQRRQCTDQGVVALEPACIQ